MKNMGVGISIVLFHISAIEVAATVAVAVAVVDAGPVQGPVGIVVAIV